MKVLCMQVFVLRNKITCAMKLDYSEEEVRNVNLTRTSSSNCTQRRQDTELGLDAVDDRNVFGALLRSACSTT